MTNPNTSIAQPLLSSEIFGIQRKTALKWRETTAKERIEKLEKLQKWVLANKELIQDAIYADFKKPPIESDLSEIFPVTSEISHAIKNLKAWMKPQKVPTPIPMLGTSGKIFFEPKGVSLIIGPWNYPFNLTVGPLVSALAAGCPVMLKPSELTPNTSILIEKMISELFDPSEVAVFQGGVEVSQTLLKLPFEHIFFTGSPKVGKIVMEAAAKNLTSVTLELGGKSPAIITQDADLADAAEKLIGGKFINNGQTCVAPDYLLVHSEIKERLISELKITLQKMYDPKFKGIENSPDLARVINDSNYERLNDLLKDALIKGAKLEFGGENNASSRYIAPTLLSQTSENMAIMQEEIFGPILPIVEYSDLKETIDYINSKPKPLALYYFGKKNNDLEEVLKNTSSGNAVVNDCVIHFLHSNLPFGGVNNSGIGSAHGHFGFLAFSHQKGVLTQRVGYNNVSLLRPPYSPTTKKILNQLMKWF